MQKLPSPITRRTRAAFLAMAGFGVGIAGAACDSTAEISFPEVRASNVQSVGLVHDSASCDSSDVSMTLQFNVASTSGDLLEPGDFVARETITLGETFSWDDVTLTDTFIYPSPDVFCATSADCAAVGPGFECQQRSQRAESPFVCASNTNVNVIADSLRHSAPAGEEIDVAYAMFYGETLLGMDRTQSPPRQNQDFSTDPRDRRITGSSNMLGRFANGRYADGMEACLATFAGQGAGSVVFEPTIDDCFVSVSDSDLRSTLTGFGNGERQSNGEDNDRAVWAAGIAAVNQVAARGADAQHVLIFTDGPDTGSLAESGQTFTQLRDLATQGDIELHFVQLDSVPDVIGGPWGPLDEYAQAACATSGSYQYAAQSTDLSSLLRSLGNGVASHYELDVEFPALSSADIAPGAYRIRATLGVQMGGRGVSQTFQADGSQSAEGDVVDNRFTVFRRPVPAIPDRTPDDETK